MHWRKLILGLVASALPVLAHAAAGDPAKGEATFKQMCGVCHVAVEDGKLHPGPHLRGVLGRKSGAVAGFNYSPALKGASLTWTPPTLDKFLASPQGVVPGSFMVVKLGNPAQRQDVLAYLSTVAGAPTQKK